MNSLFSLKTLSSRSYPQPPTSHKLLLQVLVGLWEIPEKPYTMGHITMKASQAVDNCSHSILAYSEIMTSFCCCEECKSVFSSKCYACKQ